MIAGPASSGAATPESTKMPGPMIAAMPNAVSVGVLIERGRCVRSSASSSVCSIGFVRWGASDAAAPETKRSSPRCGATATRYSPTPERWPHGGGVEGGTVQRAPHQGSRLGNPNR